MNQVNMVTISPQLCMQSLVDWLFCDCICINYKTSQLKAKNNHFTHVFLTYFDCVHQSLNIYWINIPRLDADLSRNVFWLFLKLEFKKNWTIISHGCWPFRNIYRQTVNECSKNLYSDTIQQPFSEYSYNVHFEWLFNNHLIFFKVFCHRSK